ncbi:MAG: tricarballylate dehydrogenase [Candidatus Poriferisodalaceae bacterium]|jgi:tricarballylate dehydrogenase|tara:strand:- start:416 stop:1909 length:1494 start_codon:yes stop_codon:yes gene_type:complete
MVDRTENYDVVVVGAGNAAACAALAATDQGAKVLVLERAPMAESGGNTRFTAGAIRFAYNGVEDLKNLMPDLTDSEIEMTDFGVYSEGDFYEDMGRVTDYRTDPELANTLVSESYKTVSWMQTKGVRFAPIWGRQAFKVDGRFKFWGGLTVEAWGGGEGLHEAFTSAFKKNNIDLVYGTAAKKLLVDDEGVRGVQVRSNGKASDIYADSVVLASGGFQANTEWRTRYLGPGWDLAKVRGSRFNTGDGIQMALEIGAMPYGNWSGAHAVGWEYNAPEFGDLAVGDGFQKHSYPFGLIINNDGNRFVDEGADFRNYTYAKYGREILAQPSHSAWQIFDAKVDHLLRDEYRIKQVTKVQADSLEELCARMEGVDSQEAFKTITQFNSAVSDEITFNPNVKDGRNTKGLALNKSNWANRIDTGPFQAYNVTCGLTFTFGGLRINEKGQVLDTDLNPISGLFAAGELVGGLFYGNYPGGTGLMAGAVFGRLAGTNAGTRKTN